MAIILHRLQCEKLFVDFFQTIDQLLMEHSLYTQEELERYRSSIEQQEQNIKDKLEMLKAEAKNLGGLRKELSDEKMAASRVSQTYN